MHEYQHRLLAYKGFQINISSQSIKPRILKSRLRIQSLEKVSHRLGFFFRKSWWSVVCIGAWITGGAWTGPISIKVTVWIDTCTWTRCIGICGLSPHSIFIMWLDVTVRIGIDSNVPGDIWGVFCIGTTFASVFNQHSSKIDNSYWANPFTSMGTSVKNNCLFGDKISIPWTF